jgi:hypothetical protein
VSSVIAIVAWPRRSWTTFGWTPASSVSVAWVCLKSCNRIFGNPVSRTWWSNERENVRGQIGVPFSRQKTSPWSS